MTLLRKTLLYAGLDQREFSRLLPQARSENEGKLRAYALVSLGLFLGLLVADLVVARSASDAVTLCYAAMALFSALILALARTLPVRRPEWTTPLCYAFVAGLYAFALAVNAFRPDLPAVAAIAILLMGPFLFTERPVHLICMNVAAIILLCAISFRVKPDRLATLDLRNSVAFGIVSIAAEIMQERLRFQLLSQAERITYLSETDVLTGCRNRNCYEERLSGYPAMCGKNLVCVYVDVNGLHGLNDTRGHDAGDAMLRAVARELLESFGGKHTYRIGGDEFVVMRVDASVRETQQMLNRVIANLADQGYDISVGVEASDKAGLDMAELIRRSEDSMYRIKKAYYEQEGHDRRR